MRCANLQNNQSQVNLIIVAGFLILAAILAAQLVIPNGHALEKHGIAASDAAFCFSGGGELQLLANNPNNGRCASVAKMLEKFYIRIQEANGDEVTMFCKDKFDCIEQVKRYLTNRGYQLP